MNARELHGQASTAQEKGDFLEALKLNDEALIAYQDEGDKLGFAEVLAQRFLTLRHLYEKTEDKNYLILAKHQAMASVEIAENSGEKTALAIPYFNLAKSLETLNECEEAVEMYKKAIQNQLQNPAENHARPAVVADFKAHMSTCEYKAGDKGAIKRAEEAIEDLKNSDEPKYNKDVWVSGTYMRMTEVIKNDEPTKAREYLNEAKTIIDGNSELVLRKQQWEKLAKSFA